jgi:hypothetical protein
VAFDEGRFGLITWLRRSFCPLGERPPWIVQDEYEWFWLYAAVEPCAGYLGHLFAELGVFRFIERAFLSKHTLGTYNH